MADIHRDDGHYSCVVVNEIGNTSRNYIVKITGYILFINFLVSKIKNF